MEDAIDNEKYFKDWIDEARHWKQEYDNNPGLKNAKNISPEETKRREELITRLSEEEKNAYINITDVKSGTSGQNYKLQGDYVFAGRKQHMEFYASKDIIQNPSVNSTIKNAVFEKSEKGNNVLVSCDTETEKRQGIFSGINKALDKNGSLRPTGRGKAVAQHTGNLIINPHVKPEEALRSGGAIIGHTAMAAVSLAVPKAGSLASAFLKSFKKIVANEPTTSPSNTNKTSSLPGASGRRRN